MKLSDGLQKLISFGYLFLVVIGVLKESIFYYQIGINILNYSTITDILTSPIADLTSHPIVFVSLLTLVTISYSFPLFLSKRSDKEWVQKFSKLKNQETLNETELAKHFTDMFVSILATALLSFFIGFGYSRGEKLSRKIKNNSLEYNHKLTYMNGEEEEVYLIDSNSLYYFYLKKGKNNIKIAPIGAIKTIEITQNKMLN